MPRSISLLVSTFHKRSLATLQFVSLSHIFTLLNSPFEQGILYSFPTGGQEAGETLDQAVQREVSEEVGCEAKVGPLLWVCGLACCRSSMIARKEISTVLKKRGK
ncbi:NUDIX domain-containing protein [Ktedonobacter racemifer]|uniref:NUDIX domain-containing protein n=1 Tax=Ktedonobacter racemifer TaxID=363277 RepID=UPI0009489EFC